MPRNAASNARPRDQPSSRQPCYRCGRSNHEAKDCRFADATCHHCGKKGHIAPACKTKKQQTQSRTAGRRPPHRATWVDVGGADADDVPRTHSREQEDLQLFTVGKRSSRPIVIEPQVNGKTLPMEIDTGAAVALISESVQKREYPSAVLRPSDVTLRTYTDERMDVLGEIWVDVAYESQKKTLPLVVVAGSGPTLFGRNWLEHLQVNWRRVLSVTTAPSTEDKLQVLLKKYHQVFSDELGTIRDIKATLQVRPEVQPKFCKARTVPYSLRPAVEQELERLEASGILEPVSHSEWAAPIVVVPKKDGKYRICGDYKVTVNQALDVEQYPLPKPEDLFATLSGGAKFSKLDLSQAYLQLLLDEASRPYVNITTHRGLYRYTRLPFGVASAPAIFQKVMDTILQGMDHVICYLDDILVTGKDDAEHLQTLEEVLKRLEQHGLRTKQSKCEFLSSSVEYLGHRIDAKGLHATPDKLQAITKAPTPKNVQELRSFLGLLNYYGKFIPNLATLLHPLNSLLRREATWNWTPACAEAFQKAKDTLISSQVLAHYSPELPIKMAADASAYGVGAVISHVLPNGSEHPVAFASRTLSPSECNYAQIEKEALALIFGIKKFHQYLYGRKFTLVTDHKPLKAILGPKKGIPSLAAARLQRWAIILASYNYELEFRPTQEHCNADALSRLPLPRPQHIESSCDPSVFNIRQIKSLPLTFRSIQRATQSDPILKQVYQYTTKGWPNGIPDTLKPYHTRQSELTVEGGCLLWGMRVIIPQSLQQALLQELHRDHPGVSRMKALARSYLWWPKLDQDLEKLAKSCQACQSVKQAPPTAPLHPWVWPTKPWQRIHIDYAGPFQGNMYLVVVDAHSKWPEVFEMSQSTTVKTITALRHLFATYGLPEQVVSDNGPQFTSEEFKEFMTGNGIKHIRCAPYHPASNGAAERFVRTFKEAMKASKHDGLSSQHRLHNFLLTYRITPHATTNVAPCSLFLGRSIRTRFDLLQPSVEKTVLAKQAAQSDHHNQRARYRHFHTGQAVMVRNFRPGPSWVPGIIQKQLGPLSFMVNTQGQLWKRHTDHLRACGDSTTSQPPAMEQETTETETDYASSFPLPQPTAQPTTAATNSDSSAESATQPVPQPTSQQTTQYPRRTRQPPDRLIDSNWAYT